MEPVNRLVGQESHRPPIDGAVTRVRQDGLKAFQARVADLAILVEIELQDHWCVVAG